MAPPVPFNIGAPSPKPSPPSDPTAPPPLPPKEDSRGSNAPMLSSHASRLSSHSNRPSLNSLSSQLGISEHAANNLERQYSFGINRVFDEHPLENVDLLPKARTTYTPPETPHTSSNVNITFSSGNPIIELNQQRPHVPEHQQRAINAAPEQHPHITNAAAAAVAALSAKRDDGYTSRAPTLRNFSDSGLHAKRQDDSPWNQSSAPDLGAARSWSTPPTAVSYNSSGTSGGLSSTQAGGASHGLSSAYDADLAKYKQGSRLGGFKPCAAPSSDGATVASLGRNHGNDEPKGVLAAAEASATISGALPSASEPKVGPDMSLSRPDNPVVFASRLSSALTHNNQRKSQQRNIEQSTPSSIHTRNSHLHLPTLRAPTLEHIPSNFHPTGRPGRGDHSASNTFHPTLNLHNPHQHGGSSSGSSRNPRDWNQHRPGSRDYMPTLHKPALDFTHDASQLNLHGKRTRHHDDGMHLYNKRFRH